MSFEERRSFVELLKQTQKQATGTPDPWRLRLERLRGKTDYQGLEHVTTQAVLDFLEVPQRGRNSAACRHLAKVMLELGWTPVRVRDLTRGGYKEQVRGYCRDARCTPTHK